MNELKHLKRLSAVKSSTGIKFLTPAVAPGSHCPMRIASVVVEEIQGLSSLLVGMPECATHSRLFSPKPEGKHGELHWLYSLDGHEVVFGCRDGLIDALRTMDKVGAKAILLIVTCVPELIGEDIEGIIREVQSELSTRVTFVMLGQFKNISHPPGSWKTMEALSVLMDRKETDPKRINVLGRAPEEDHFPMPSVLHELTQRGFALRYLAPGASVEDFQSAPDAVLNIVTSPYTQPLAVKMEQEFSIPYLALHDLYDAEDIHRTYGALAERFGFSWKDAFEEERDSALDLQNQAKERLKGLRYVLSTRLDMPLPLSIFLTRLGMEPLLLHLEEFYPENKAHAKELVDSGHNPWICRMVNVDLGLADLTILQKLAPDLCFGFLPYNNKTIPCVGDMMDFYGQIGYGRTTNLLKRILSVLDRKDAVGKGAVGNGTASI
jgi:nitrogenase molybdenum-iron protein alpha/beta subunit